MSRFFRSELEEVRVAWIEVAAVGAATVAATAAYVWLSRLNVDLGDEGYFLDLASRVQAGQLPYRDFDTYYTPGIFYLNSVVLTLFGTNILPPRLVMAAVRVGCALLAYILARRLTAPAFAAVPAVLIAMLGVLVGSHPGWPALLATLLMIAALIRANDAGHRGWLALAGAAAAIAFVFKQNVGAFALLGAAGYVVLVSGSEAGVLLLGIRALFAAAVALITYRFLGPPDTMLMFIAWLPIAAILVILVAWSRPVWNRTSPGMDVLLRDGLALCVGAGGATAAWLVPLALALGVENTPVGLFLGNVNRGALIFGLDRPPQASALVALVAVWAPLGVVFAFRPRSATLIATTVGAVVLTPFLLQLPTRGIPLDPLTSDPEQFPRLAALDTDFGSLLLYLPGLCAWAAIVLLVKQRRRFSGAPVAAWFALIGVLAQLALFPRADTAHAILAGVPLLVAGGWVLGVVYAPLGRDLLPVGKVALFVALLTLPAAAVTPQLYGRSIALRHSEADPTVAPRYVPLGLDRAAIVLPEGDGKPLRDAVAFVRDRTAPGEPLFAYPMDPLVNFLTDRPNPTRFDEFLPGALSADDMRGVIADLEVAKPQYVFWDHGAVEFWETDRPNRILSDYIWRCYTEVAAFQLYLVLERDAC